MINAFKLHANWRFLKPDYESLLVNSLRLSSMKKKINRTMWEKLLKVTEKANRQKLNAANVLSPALKLAKLPQNINSKELAKQTIARENMLSIVLMKEIQGIIDSGQAGTDLEELKIQFSKVIFKSKQTCYITWETQGPSLDKDIHVLLTRSAGLIRHLVMDSHVMGNVPKFIFAIDERVVELQTVGKIMSSEHFDMGPIGDDCDELYAAEDNTDVVSIYDQNADETKKKKDDISDFTYNLFGVDCTTLRQKIVQRKSQVTNTAVDTFSNQELR